MQLHYVIFYETILCTEKNVETWPSDQHLAFLRSDFFFWILFSIVEKPYVLMVEILRYHVSISSALHTKEAPSRKF